MEIRIPLADFTEVYSFLDPAGTKYGKSTNARIARNRTAISVVGVDELERFYWLYCWAKVVANVSEVIDKVNEVQRTFNPLVFGCEANAMQHLFVEMLERESLREKVHLPLAAITQPTGIDKDFRDRCILHPVFNEGRFICGPDIPEDCRLEVRGFPLTSKRDVIDSVASAIALAPPRRREGRAAGLRLQAAYEREAAQLYVSGPEVIQDERWQGEAQGEADPFAELRGLG